MCLGVRAGRVFGSEGWTCVWERSGRVLGREEWTCVVEGGVDVCWGVRVGVRLGVRGGLVLGRE